MTKEAIARQHFMDFLENLGDREYGYEEYSEEESDWILTDLFFSGLLVVKWNPEKHTLMLKSPNEK